MFNKLKNNSGFTLVEMVIAAGLTGVIALVAYTALKDSKGVVNTSVVGGEITFLKNQVIANMGNPENCNANFEGQDITRSDILALTRKQRKTGVPDTFDVVNFLEKGKSYGESSANTIVVTNIKSAQTLLQAVPPIYNPNTMTITVSYTIRDTLKRSSGKKSDAFSVEVAIARTTNGLKVKNCFADVAGMIRKAIQFSCEGPGAVYDAGGGTYGTCTHNPLRVENDIGTTVTPVCPVGQFLIEVKSAGGVTNYKCKKFSTLTPSCGIRQYMKGIKSDGSPDCVSLDTLLAGISNGYVISTADPGVYQQINLNCSNVNEVLQTVSSTGTPNCTPKVIVGMCNPGLYITGINPDGSPQCTAFPKNTASACPAGTYLMAVNPDGSVPAGGCKALVINANCPGANDVMTAIDTNGNATCVTNLNPP